MKPNPVGMKNFVCTTADGIVLDFDIFKVQMHCLSRSKNQRFFTTIQGVEGLMKKQLYVTGTVRKNGVAAAVQKLQ